MAEIRPFRFLRYSTKRVSLDQVVTQPYDKISPEMQTRYRERHPNNLVRILRCATEPDQIPGESPYDRADNLFGQWRREGIIEQIREPCLFAYFQRYRLSKGDPVRTRKGFVGLTHLEDYAAKIVFPHERTLTGPKMDRLELLRHTETHFGQVFLLYSDPVERVDNLLDKIAAKSTPEMSVRDEYDVEHMLWRIADPVVIEEIQVAMAEKKLIIADGHHRYETALQFRDEKRVELETKDAGEFEWLMTTLVNMDSPGMTILPTHRLLRNLPKFDVWRFLERARQYFDVSELKNLPELEAGLRQLAVGHWPAIGMAAGAQGPLYMLSLQKELDLGAALPGVSPSEAELDVVILHRLVLERCLDISEADVSGESFLDYVRGAEAAVQQVWSGAAQACFILNATRIDQVRDIALKGGVLPQKSTDFFPKLLSGLAMYRMAAEEESQSAGNSTDTCGTGH